ncbi:unnamed protein product [Caenorhabditis bovis]|uniref:Uncharacterized protein n=1 Tax=Caenorhabditis bovis TaxID=2654633 RepID=A0A8S1E6Y6_9PELO|nr:unnamed protein product [Caenorhabditis bovis]
MRKWYAFIILADCLFMTTAIPTRVSETNIAKTSLFLRKRIPHPRRHKRMERSLFPFAEDSPFPFLSLNTCKNPNSMRQTMACPSHSGSTKEICIDAFALCDNLMDCPGGDFELEEGDNDYEDDEPEHFHHAHRNRKKRAYYHHRKRFEHKRS